MNDETIRTKAISYTRSHLKEIAAYAIAVASSVVSVSVAYGHKQAATEADRAELIAKVDGIATDMRTVKDTLQQHGERMAAMEATSSMTQSDVHDLKALADHARDVADTFQVKRFNTPGHRAKH